MKRIILPLSVLLLAACTPKDVAILGKDQRDKFSTKAATVIPGQVKFGSYGASAFLMEKQGEVLQILSSSNSNQAQGAGPYTIDKSLGSGQVQIIFTSTKDYTTTMPDFALVQNAQWKSIIERDDVNSLSITAGSNGEDGSLQILVPTENSKFAGQGITLRETKARIVADPVKDDNSLKDVTYSSEGSLEVTKDGVTEVMPFKLSLEMRVKTLDFQEAGFDILSSEISINLLRKNNGADAPMNVGLKMNPGDVVHFKNDKVCPAITGQSVMVTDNAQRKIVFDDQTVTVPGTKKPYYQVNHGACGQRPTVDLSHLLIY